MVLANIHSLSETKPTLRSWGPNVDQRSLGSAAPLPPVPLSHTSVRSLELEEEAPVPLALPQGSTWTVPAEALFHRTTPGWGGGAGLIS